MLTSAPSLDARAWVAELQAVGVHAVHDVRKVAPPCVLFTPPRVDLDRMCGGTGSWQAFVVAATVGNSDAWQQLDALMPRVLRVLPVESVEPASVDGDTGTQYPALRLSWEQSVEWKE